MLEQWMNDLRYGCPQQRAAAAFEFGQRRLMDALPLLVQALLDEDSRVRMTAAMALAQYGSMGQSALPNLIKCLNDVSWSVRKEAITALGAIGQPEVVKPLLHLIAQSQSPASETQHLAVVEALAALGRFSGRNVLDTLIKMLEKGYHNAFTDWQLLARQTAALSLGRLDQPEGNKALVACLYQKERPELRYTMSESLALLRSEQSFKLMLDALARRGNEDPEISWNRQEVLVRALGGRGDRRAVPYLSALASIQQPEVRLALVYALVRLGDVSQLGVLINMLRDGTPEVRAATAYALGQLQVRAACPALEVMSRDSNPAVAQAARNALVALGMTVSA
jgi:HEAT repeat protein